LSEVAAHLENGFPKETEIPLRAVFIGKASDRMLEAAVRLGKLFQVPEDALVLGLLVIKEIFYHLIKGPDGPAIRQFVRSGSKVHKISQAIYSLRSGLSEDVDVTSLARAANMSRSAFFKHFKEVTAMSPIQYQKRLRLLEARRLMTDDGETAEGSAFKVGYNSASQFSREYSRMFGNPPLRDAMKVKETDYPIQQM
jgi:AraC-like DNA-binding protein